MRAATSFIAQELVSASAQASPEERANLMDIALAAARRQGVSGKNFVKALRRAARAADDTMKVRIDTPEHLHATSEEMKQILVKTMDRPVSVTHRKADLIGGAVVTVGDDRFDFSITSALLRAKNVLRA